MTMLFFLATLALGHPAPGLSAPLLIGAGCDGSDVPLYRRYEDEFPSCQRIELLPLPIARR